MSGYWPQLALIKLQATAQLTTKWYYRLFRNRKVRLIATLVFTHVHLFHYKTAFVVSPTHQRDQHKSIATAFNHLQGPEWQRMTHVAVTAHVHSQAENIVAQMAISEWLGIEDLKLMCVCASSLKQVAKGSWPRLQGLDLADS